MQAAWYERKGDARDVLVCGELGQPEPPPGHVRVRVRASGVNPSDVKMRGAQRGREMPFPRVVPHQDGAGEIDAVGDGVAASRVGERVWIYMATWGRWQGTAAEWTVVPSERAVPLPATASFETGATLGVPAMTACRALACDGGVRGKRVLVQGGSGAVAHYAIQLARHLGASSVVAIVGGEPQARLAQSAGADLVIDRSGDVRAELRAAFGSVDCIDRVVEVEFGRNLAFDIEVLREGGVLIAYGSDQVREPVFPFGAALYRDLLLRCLLIYLTPPDETARIVSVVNAALDCGALRSNVAKVLPLAEITTAHELQERGGALGKILVRP